MRKMFRHMKKYAGVLALIVVLLVVQAMCELWLPTYTAAMVDVGIQQEGIESSVPVAVRESTLERLKLWMPREAVDTLIGTYYAPGAPEHLRKLGVTNTAEPVLVLGEAYSDIREQLEALFNRAFLMESVLNGSSELDIGALVGADSAPRQDVTPEQTRAMLSQLDADQRAALLAAIDAKLLTVLPESTLEQAAIAAVKGEYAALGINLRAMQSSAIRRLGMLMLLVALASSAAAVAVGFFGSRVSAGLGRDLRQLVFHKVLGFGQQEMDSFSTASLITRTTNDIQQVQNVMVMLLRMVIYAPIIGVGGIIRALDTNAGMAWIIALGVIVVLCIVLTLFMFAMPRFKRMQKQVDAVNRVMRETLTGLPVIRAFCTQSREEERFDEASAALKKTQLFVGRLMGGMMPLMMLAMNGISILILWVGAGSIDSGAMQVGDMMAFIQYTMQIISAFLMISMLSVMLPRASVSANRIQEVLDTPLTITDPDQPADFAPDMRGTVEFRDVCFRYPGADEDMLSHISFTAKPGETTAILGGTGSGKSTLINLIPRFYDATGGEVLVDGRNVKDVRLNDLRDRIGYVPQKGVLFTGTVAENLAFGSDTISLARVQEAARIAQADGFISQRSDGYDSEIAQGGANVSGGQKQRLSIARAVAKNPEIYIFDDSFSALDFKTDAAVRSALRKATSNAAMLIVAQRISTVMHAEQILVLDEGRLVGKGTHEQLMRDCEVYRQIAMSQLSKEELENGTQN